MTPEEEKAFSGGIKAMFADGRLTDDTGGMEEYESPLFPSGFRGIRGNGKQGFIGPSGQAFVWHTDEWLKPMRLDPPKLDDMRDFPRLYKRYW